MEIRPLLIEKAGQSLETLNSALKKSSTSFRGLPEEGLVEEYINKSCDVYQAGENLLTLTIKEGQPAQLIKYDVVSALGFLASLITGIAGAPHPVLLGLSVIGSLTSIKGLSQKGSEAEALLLWITYDNDGHKISRTLAKEKFSLGCETNVEIEASDFNAALQGLIDLEIVEIDGESLKVVEKIVIIWPHKETKKE